jgi:hypothetical protein
MSKPKEIPILFDKGQWKKNSSVFNLFADTGVNLVSDLNLTDMKIFGNSYKSWIMEHDFFTKYTFNNKKLKPAYFNVADVKVPYEASRLQHLQKQNISVFFNNANKTDNSLLNLEVDKFPLIYWNSPMDVAIRTINLIIHRQFVANKMNKSIILNNSEEQLDTYISQHYQYVKDNLENEGNVVGNHYLVELSCMLFYLANYENDNYTDDLAFVTSELSNELARQFNKEGTNFEGSSHYAAFATEALILCKLSLKDIGGFASLADLLDSLIIKNKRFLSLLIIENELSQIGDNDSGRIFYFAFNEDKPLHMSWLIKLIDSFKISDNLSDKAQKKQIKIKKDLPDFTKLTSAKHPDIKVFSQEYQAYAYVEFGIYIWRNEKEYFSIRCGPIGQHGIGGHSHYDQLSIECFSNNEWVARDPGTGTYTDNIQKRNNFRSMQYHWGPNIDLNLRKEDEFDCFKLNNIGNGEALLFDKKNFVGVADFEGSKIYRKLSINDGIITVEDFSILENLERYETWGEMRKGIKVEFSEGYKRFS